MKRLVEAVVAVAREANARMVMASESATSTNLMEEIIRETVITLEMVFKRGEIAGCDTASTINFDVLIPTPQFFMLRSRFIQALSVIRLIMTIGSCQALLPIVGLLKACLE